MPLELRDFNSACKNENDILLHFCNKIHLNSLNGPESHD